MSVPNTSELDDDQIEALIRKLSAIKGSAPELIAALEAEASSRQANKGRGRGGSRGRGGTARTSRSHSYEEEEEEEFDDDYDDEEDDDEETDSEDDDEFDEDGPCVGYGYSDEVSVISEMTTPTVVSNIHVPAEERYDELHQGYGKKSNKPDLLSQVNRANAAKGKKGPAGLDQEKRKNYASKLGKISETAETAAVTKPKTAKPTKKTPTRRASGDGPAPAAAPAPATGGTGIRKSSSRGLQKKKVPTTTMSGGKKSNHSSGSKGSKNSQNDHADAFGDDWHKSLNSGDIKGTDDNGFPFDFGDNNAFAESSNSFFKKGSGGGGGGDDVDAFDPFSNGDPFKSSDAFDTNNNAFAAKKKVPSRERRASAVSGKSRPSKTREGSPRRKGPR